MQFIFQLGFHCESQLLRDWGLLDVSRLAIWIAFSRSEKFGRRRVP
jgi:hypothetical protein